MFETDLALTKKTTNGNADKAWKQMEPSVQLSSARVWFQMKVVLRLKNLRQ